MYIVLGGTGHVGSALTRELLARGETVTVISHDPDKREPWERRGAAFALADVGDTEALREIFARGRRLFLLNPPAPPDTDTDAVEQAGVRSIVDALHGSRLERIVAESTYGAQPAQRAGDLGVLYDLEQALRLQPIAHRAIRAAYYMSNWDAALDTARERGVVESFFPADFLLPMVAPQDLGLAAADLLTAAEIERQPLYVEGPRRYCPADVASCFASALNRSVEVEVVPRERWVERFRELGFSQPGAESYARMTALTLDQGSHAASEPRRGDTTLREYIDALVGVD